MKNENVTDGQIDETASGGSTRRQVLQVATGTAAVALVGSGSAVAREGGATSSVADALQVARARGAVARNIRLPRGVEMEGDVGGMISPEVAQSLQNIVVEMPAVFANNGAGNWYECTFREVGNDDEAPVSLRFSAGGGM